MTSQEILNRKPATKTLDIDGLGAVSFRKLTAADVELCRVKYGTPETAAAGLCFVVVRGVVGDDAKRIFTVQDIDKVGELEFDIVKALAEAIADFSGLKATTPAATAAN